MPSLPGNLNLVSKFKTSEITTMVGETSHGGQWGAKPHSRVNVYILLHFWGDPQQLLVTLHGIY